MFKEDTLYLLITNWWRYKPEDELYYKLQDNPYYPFKKISEGYFQVIVQSDRAAYGIWFLLVSVITYGVLTYTVGVYALPQSFIGVAFFFCFWTLRGRLAWRELIISRRGRGSYMLRVWVNQEKLLQHELRNIYIRLAKKEDSSGDPYFWLNLSGYELDDYRITRMTKAENALRIMGMRIAYRLGVNFFDWKDESEDHLIFHYKSHTKLHFHPPIQPKHERKSKTSRRMTGESADERKSHHLHVPVRKPRRSSGSGSDSEASPAKQKKLDEEDPLARRRQSKVIFREH